MFFCKSIFAMSECNKLTILLTGRLFNFLLFLKGFSFFGGAPLDKTARQAYYL